MNSVFGPKIFSLSFSHSYPHSLFQFLSHFKFQKISLISFHSIPFHFISFLFHLISISFSISIQLPLIQRAHFQFQFPSGCHFGRNSNYSTYVATVLRRILIQRPSTPRDVCPSTRASLRPHFIIAAAGKKHPCRYHRSKICRERQANWREATAPIA